MPAAKKDDKPSDGSNDQGYDTAVPHMTTEDVAAPGTAPVVDVEDVDDDAKASLGLPAQMLPENQDESVQPDKK